MTPADIDTLIVLATRDDRTAEERAKSALEACAAIRANDVKLTRAFDWCELKAWAAARQQERFDKARAERWKERGRR